MFTGWGANCLTRPHALCALFVCFLFVCLFVCMYVCMCVYTYVYIYIYIYIYIHSRVKYRHNVLHYSSLLKKKCKKSSARQVAPIDDTQAVGGVPS